MLCLPLTTTAMHMVALEAVKWLAGYRYQGQHSIWTMDSFDLRGRHHELRARPQCPQCALRRMCPYVTSPNTGADD